jgi:uncharacterized protein YlxP (DUF503 family)
MGFSVSQVGPTNLVQQAWLTATFISGSEAGVNRMMDQAEKLLYSPDWELVVLEMDILGNNEVLPEWEHI